MSTQHTLVQWRVYEAGVEVPGYHVHDRIVSDVYTGRSSSDGPTQADLQLMAAAPRLFAALRALYAICACMELVVEVEGGSAQELTDARKQYDDAMSAAASALHTATGRAEK